MKTLLIKLISVMATAAVGMGVYIIVSAISVIPIIYRLIKSI